MSELTLSDEDRIDVSVDGKTVWVHGDDGSTVGRFSKTFGMDVHTTITEQLAGATQCLHCTHEAPGVAEWHAFCDLMLKHYGVTVDRGLLRFESEGPVDLDPASIREGMAVRLRPAGRSCTIAQIASDRSKVLVNDCGKRFWVKMDRLVSLWY